MDIQQQVKAIVDNIIAEVNTNIQSQIESIVEKQVTALVKKIPIQQMFEQTFASGLTAQTFEFPDASIPATAIQSGNLALSGSQISGGIIENFGSTGIDDKSTQCQLTILDEAIVVENNLLTRDLTVKGTVNIEGDLNITGVVPKTSTMYTSLVADATNNVRASLNDSVFAGFSSLVFKQIKEEGLDLTKITLNGQEIVNGPNLSSAIVNSNLRTVGALTELQVVGESLFSSTLYVTNKRVGVNTIEPNQSLSIWDQEVEIGFGKLETNVGIIGLPRNQSLVLSTNGKKNITLSPDGGVAVDAISIGQITVMSSDSPPANDMPKGTVVFNSNPNIGGPMGWVSLGGARWANFGVID
jgi:hypothetical protein